jgi:hypothetical protein
MKPWHTQQWIGVLAMLFVLGVLAVCTVEGWREHQQNVD